MKKEIIDNNDINKNLRDFANGDLTNSQKHLLEKQAMDNPFLNDALDGLFHQKPNFDADINDIHNKINLPSKDKSVFDIFTNKQFLGIAATIIGVLCIGFLFKMNDNTKNEDNIVKNETQNEVLADNTNTQSATIITPEQKDELIKKDSVEFIGKPIDIKAIEAGKINNTITIVPQKNKSFESDNTIKVEDVKYKINTDSVVTTDINVKDIATIETTSNNAPTINPSQPVIINEKDDYKKEEIAKSNQTLDNNQQVSGNLNTNNGLYNITQNNKPRSGVKFNQMVERKNVSKKEKQKNEYNKFFISVSDSENQLLPFAKITIPEVNVKTYTDKNGNGRLVSQDSSIKANISGWGYFSDEITLKPNIINKVVLKKNNNSNKIVEKIIYIEPKNNNAEPECGYDLFNTYLNNNSNLPTKYNEKTVLNFLLDNNGKPYSINCNPALSNEKFIEIKRLLEIGPNWKLNNTGKIELSLNL